MATFERLNSWYYADAPWAHWPELDLARRQNTFEEVVGGLTEENVLFGLGGVSPAATALSATIASASARTMQLSSSANAPHYKFDYNSRKGCGIRPENARVARSRCDRAGLPRVLAYATPPVATFADVRAAHDV